MSWLSTLAQTYDDLWEYESKHPGTIEGLYPPATITQNAHLELVLNDRSELVRGEVISKENASTIVPVTLSSAGRTSSPEPHSLFDNLMYLAGDLKDYYVPKSSREDPYNKNFLPYKENLKKWLDYSHNPFLQIVYVYIEKEAMVKDLIDIGILKLNEEGVLDPEFKIQGMNQEKLFIRFSIEKEGQLYPLAKNRDLFSDYSSYYTGILQGNDGNFCYATGEKGYMTDLHGKNIRYAGDGSKLISSNDSSNFTYRGRFADAGEAFKISYEVSEKAHSALRYLIRNQGYSKNGYTVVAWSANDKVIQPMLGSNDLFEGIEGLELPSEEINTEENFSGQLSKAIRSLHHQQLDTGKTINIMAIDGATPGRMSILYYGEKDASDYLSAIEKWHRELAWKHFYQGKKTDGGKFKIYSTFGAPSALDIVICAYGAERGEKMTLGNNDKFLNHQLQRLLPCIVDGAKLPTDFAKGVYKNAVSPQKKNWFNWQKCLSVGCSVIRKYYIDRKGVEYTMALDKENRDRSYLYGRLLAVADKVETDALKAANSERETMAGRYMDTFSKRPYKTWKTIELGLTPYWKILAKKGNEFSAGRIVNHKKLLNEIMSKFDPEDFENNHPLEPSFLLGYHCQLNDFYTSTKEEEK